VECEGDKWCFWNEELLSVLKCDEVEIKKLCEDALTEKECYIAEEGQYDVCFF
jgi:hypothetical protein